MEFSHGHQGGVVCCSYIYTKGDGFESGKPPSLGLRAWLDSQCYDGIEVVNVPSVSIPSLCLYCGFHVCIIVSSHWVGREAVLGNDAKKAVGREFFKKGIKIHALQFADLLFVATALLLYLSLAPID